MLGLSRRISAESGTESACSTTEDGHVQDMPVPPQRPRATSVSSNVEALMPNSRRPPPRGLRLSNGILHPLHMAQPGQDGYRTPTGEDFEQTKRLYHRMDSGLQRNSRLKDVSSVDDDDSSTDPAPAQTRGEQHKPTFSPPQTARGSMMQTLRTKAQEFEDMLALDWRQRLKHFTWTYFTITMATGGLSSVLYHVPFRFRGLYELGCILFILNIVLFAINIVCISLRFHLHPNTFRDSILHPTESLFIPAAVVSFGTILMNISQYAYGRVGDWINIVVMILFWVDVGLAIIASLGIYLLMWGTQTFTIATMTPIWIFPAYPLLIIGPHAGVLTSDLDPDRSARILVGGFIAQGIGMMVSLMVYSAYIYRLMTQKLPRESLRPGMFVSVGPSAFTASALINMSQNAGRVYGATDFMGDGKLAAMIIKVVASWAALWFWGLAVWFFIISVGAHYSVFFKGARMPFAMTWFSYVFPQTALINATFAVARVFSIYPLQVIGCAMTIALVLMWMFVVFMMGRALWRKQILWPQKGEDKDEGGFKGGVATNKASTASTTAMEGARPRAGENV